jgi:thiamine biosynthesis protein ThiI
MVAVDAASKMVVFRPLVGTDKEDIIVAARKIGTYPISAEPFHDCCPMFLPRQPALYASPEDLARAEEKLDVNELTFRGIRTASLLKYEYKSGRVEVSEVPMKAGRHNSQIAVG